MTRFNDRSKELAGGELAISEIVWVEWPKLDVEYTTSEKDHINRDMVLQKR